MPRRNTAFSNGESYHLYNRGNNSQKMFFVEENYLFFLDRLAEFLPESAVTIHAFCLLPNHFHFSIRLVEEFDLSEAMRQIQSTYARSFNRKYMRHGHLYDGRFRSLHIESVDYLDYLSRYIHQNPIKAGLVDNPEDWLFSSYRCYVDGERLGERVIEGVDLPRRVACWNVPNIDPSSTLARFRARSDYREFVRCDWEMAPWNLENGLWTPPKRGN